MVSKFCPECYGVKFRIQDDQLQCIDCDAWVMTLDTKQLEARAEAAEKERDNYQLLYTADSTRLAALNQQLATAQQRIAALEGDLQIKQEIIEMLERERR